MKSAAVVVVFIVAQIATVFAVWSSIADAPWEKPTASVSVYCEDALLRRRAVEDAIRSDYTVGPYTYPLRVIINVEHQEELETLRYELKQVTDDISRLCPEVP